MTKRGRLGLDFGAAVAILMPVMSLEIVHEIRVRTALSAAIFPSGRGAIAVRLKLHDPPRLR